jgi:hypothetical protein
VQVNLRQRLLELGKQLAKDNGEDTQQWGAEDIENYVFEMADWRSVLRVSWNAGSFAGIQEWCGLYLAFDDAESYGPYDSFEEARSKLQLDLGYDQIVERWVSPEYVHLDHD